MIERYSDHSANERTFLAWVRTAIAVMAFGFIVEKFDLFLEMASPALVGRTLSLPGQKFRQHRRPCVDHSRHRDGRDRRVPLPDDREDHRQRKVAPGPRVPYRPGAGGAAGLAGLLPVRLSVARPGRNALTPAAGGPKGVVPRPGLAEDRTR